MKRLTALLIAGALSGAAHAGDPRIGQQKAALCAACHGANGISNNPLWPNLAILELWFHSKAHQEARSGGSSGPACSENL